METQQEVELVNKPSLPLKIEQYEMRGKTHISVSRGTQELVIVPDKADWIIVKVNGENETVQRGRELLEELLGPSPELEFPRYGVRCIVTDEVSYELQVKTARLWNDGFIKLTKEMMDVDLTLRKLDFEDSVAMIAVANHIESAFDIFL
jgi:hypothetical protein